MGSGILVELESGKILWSRDDEAVRAPASLTKILTALVVLENTNLKDTVTITPDARAAPGSRTYAEAGWTFTVRDMLWGMLLQSGNDAAISLAYVASPDGTMEGFTKLMNETARRIGATKTTFANPHGYDQPGHVSTARDLALITMMAMEQPLFAEMVATKAHSVPWGDGGQHVFFNHNKLLHRYPGAIGVKTGFTNGAGHSLVSAVKRDGRTLLAVAMASPDHYAESIALYDWGFANLAALSQNPQGLIRRSQLQKTDRPLNQTQTNGLEVIQLRPETLAGENLDLTDPWSAPLVAPILALAAAGGISAVIVRRRRFERDRANVMSQLQRELDAVVPMPSTERKTVDA